MGQTGRTSLCSPFGPISHFLCSILLTDPVGAANHLATSSTMIYETPVGTARREDTLPSLRCEQLFLLSVP